MPSSPPSPTADVITITDIKDAAARLDGVAVETPLLESRLVNKALGARLLIKAEPLQITGSFKFRGAYNAISRIPEDRRAAGVVAYSSGNHAQGVAAASNLLGLPAVIVMPADAPAAKLGQTRAWGAEIVTYDRFGESREELGARIRAERGATLVKPYDDPLIMAGQGTAALEAIRQARAVDAAPDLFLAPCGGGGLISGCATAVKAESPDTKVYSVEPEAFDDTARSLASGNRETVPADARSICDALLAPTPGELTFAVNRERLDGGLAVSDDEALRAMALAFRYFKLVVEPGGAVALAAALTGKVDVRDRTVVVVCSGGNCDTATFADALSRPIPFE